MTNFWEAQKENAAERLREYLLTTIGSDFGLSDAQLQAVAEQQIERVRVSGRRWSWTVLAAEAIRKTYEPDPEHGES